LNFLFHLRSDALSKPGGDASLGRQYKALLEGAGHQVELTMSHAPFDGSYDAALTFNLDRPFESAQFVANCKARGVPALLYSLHHPASGVASYLRHGTAGFRRAFATVARHDPGRYETVLTAVKVLGRKFKPQRLGALRFVNTLRAQQFLLSNASAILASSGLEVDEMVREFSAPGLPYAVVPHILEGLGSGQGAAFTPGSARDIDVLCAGRIESRKNQLQVARLARRFPDTTFVFVGTPSPSEGQYFAAFRAEIDGLANVQYHPSLPIDELRQYFRRSRIFMSLSWFEVVSLTEMEAYSWGCRLIAGKYSYAKEFAAAGRASFVDPADLAAAEVELRRVLALVSGAEDRFDVTRETELLRMSPPQVLRSFLGAFEMVGIRA
jgi:glycosyltransferase involved in cell wall biosynthesis